MARKVNYLNNKDLLKEIHKSKTTYCSFELEDGDKYDSIVLSLDEINNELIEETKINKANKATKLLKEELKVQKAKPSEIKNALVEPNIYETTDLIFRVMTYEHIPLDPERKRKPKNESEHYVKLNFPPFKHYKLDEKSKPYEIGRSHWQGSIDNGHFCQEHGAIGNELAKMFVKLVERFSQKGNWRSYTYIDEMRNQALLQLSMVGLRFDESRSDNPFAYFSSIVSNSFTRVLNIEKKNQNIRDELLINSGHMPSFSKQLDEEAKLREEMQKS